MGAAARRRACAHPAHSRLGAPRPTTILFKDKIAEGRGSPYVFPHVRGTIEDAFRRAGIADVFELDAIETHDCFAVTEYMAIDHFGITAPGESWKAVEDGTIAFDGRLPINPSGGVIGLGPPGGGARRRPGAGARQR